MKRLAHAVALAVVLSIALARGVCVGAADYARITILSTTDLHGRIYPVDYNTGKPAPVGLAKIATLVRQARRDAPRALLLDMGDAIQGTPLAYYHNRVNNAPPDPMMLCMNALGYDALTPGNHEYNFGLDVLGKARGEARFPWISANTLRTGGEPAFAPYIVREIEGVRVAVLGLTTPNIPNWEDKPNYAGLDFQDSATVAKKYVPVLREKERADIVVVAMHMGVEVDMRTGGRDPGSAGNENAAVEIAENVPGVDLILMGHTHRAIPAMIVNNVLMAQAGHWGSHLARADFYMKKEDARWRVFSRTSRLIPVTENTAADPEILAIGEPYHRETQAWLDKVIGQNARELTARESRMRDTAIVDLIQRAQLKAAGAEVSFAASFNTAARVRAGDITVRDLYSLYSYENTLVAIELTGAQIKDALEHAARYYVYDAQTGAVTENASMPGYAYDMAEGVTYEIDPSREIGRRVVNLRWRGEPIDPARAFRVAINNYRLNGGGGYTMFKNAPVLWRSSSEVRDLLIKWVETHKAVPAEPTNNWRLIGRE